MKETLIYRIPHGYNRGGVYKTDVCPTLLRNIQLWHPLLAEVEMQIGNIMPTKNRDNPNQGRVYSANDDCPSLNCMEGGGRQPMVIIYDDYNNHIKADQSTIGTLTTNIGSSTLRNGTKIIEGCAMRGRYNDEGLIEQQIELNGTKCANSITTVHKDSMVRDITGYKIRKLTPLERWRLMGFADEDFHKAEKVNSRSQLYKQRGNSIVVNTLEGVLKNLVS